MCSNNRNDRKGIESYQVTVTHKQKFDLLLRKRPNPDHIGENHPFNTGLEFGVLGDVHVGTLLRRR